MVTAHFHTTLWIDFKICLDIGLKTSSSFGFCDKDYLFSLYVFPLLFDSLLGSWSCLGFAILSLSSFSSLPVYLVFFNSPLCSSSMMKLERSTNESKLWSQPDLGLISGLDIYKLGNLGQIYLQLHFSVSHLSNKDNNYTASRSFMRLKTFMCS